MRLLAGHWICDITHSEATLELCLTWIHVMELIFTTRQWAIEITTAPRRHLHIIPWCHTLSLIIVVDYIILWLRDLQILLDWRFFLRIIWNYHNFFWFFCLLLICNLILNFWVTFQIRLLNFLNNKIFARLIVQIQLFYFLLFLASLAIIGDMAMRNDTWIVWLLAVTNVKVELRTILFIAWVRWYANHHRTRINLVLIDLCLLYQWICRYCQWYVLTEFIIHRV